MTSTMGGRGVDPKADVVREVTWILYYYSVLNADKNQKNIADIIYMYRVTHHVGSNLPLTSKHKFRFGQVCPDLARPKRNFCSDVKGRFEPT